MKKIWEKLKKSIKALPRRIMYVLQLFVATDMPLYSANAAFFLIITAIPLFMLTFSAFSIISYVRIEDLIGNINLLFPNLPYVEAIIMKLVEIAKSLATKDIISVNIIVAIITGSTALYSFTIGIRKIHNIKHSSNFVRLRLLSIISMFVFFIAIIVMLIAFILGSMILKLVATYIPVAEQVIDNILSFKYLVAIIILFVFMISIYGTSTNFERKIRNNAFGAIIATILWLVISNIFSFYFEHFPLSASVYGSLTGVVVVLLWLYVCMNIIFLGAVINEVHCPQKKILEEQRQYIMKELEQGNDEDVDKILTEKYKLKKIKSIDRPNLDYENNN